MSVNPGMELLEEDMIQPLADNLNPGGDYPIPVPPSGGVIIQGGNGIWMVEMPDGSFIWIDENGNVVDPWG